MGKKGNGGGKMKTSLLALLTSLAAHNPVNCDQLWLFYGVSVKLLKSRGSRLNVLLIDAINMPSQDVTRLAS